MVIGAGSQESRSVAFEMFLKDRLSSSLAEPTRRLIGMGNAIKPLLDLLGRLGISVLLAKQAMVVFGATMVTTSILRLGSNFLDFSRATRLARVQLQFLGFTAKEATEQIGLIGKIMSRAAATDFLRSQEAMIGWARAGEDTALQMGEIATNLHDITQIPTEELFTALVNLFIDRDTKPIIELLGGTESMVKALGGLDVANVDKVIELILSLASEDAILGSEKLAKNMERLTALTLPTKEAVEEWSAKLLNIIVATLVERLETEKEHIGLVITGALGGIALVAGKGFAVKMATGFIAGLGVALLLDMGTTIKTVMEDPVLTAEVITAASVLGSTIGGSLGTKIALAAAVALLPGIIDTFGGMGINQQILLAIGISAVALAQHFNVSFSGKLAIGFALITAFQDINEGGVEAGTILTLAGIAGAIIGARVGGATGAAFGIYAAVTIADEILKLGKNKVTLAGVAISGAIIGGALAISLGLTFAAVLATGIIVAAIAAAIWDITRGEDSVILDAAKAFGKWLGNLIVEGLWEPIKAFFSKMWNFIGGAISDPLNSSSWNFPPLGDIINRQYGGEIPGPVGAPRLAIVHGGETVIPVGGRASSLQPMVFQLYLDSRLISEVALDAFNRKAKFSAGLLPGTMGS